MRPSLPIVTQRHLAMATFAKGAYDVVAYNAFRPVYPPRLFDTIWAYHQSSPHARWKRAVDLGCGTGKNHSRIYIMQPL